MIMMTSPKRSLQRRAAIVLGASLMMRPALASKAELQAAIAGFTGGATPGEARVRIEIAPLVENGNAVPVTVWVDSPMTAAEHVSEIALFNELNPQRDVARFVLTPELGRARVSTRIRLASSQQLVAVARLSDGSFFAQTADVIVTLAACVE
jgi:sulfur-oxidizing protein SoxY